MNFGMDNLSCLLGSEDNAARTGGMHAHPLWCKAQKQAKKQIETSTEEQPRRRYFYASTITRPGYYTGSFSVQNQQLNLVSLLTIRPNHHMIGFFNDMDPALAGSLHVQANHLHNNPANCRDFYCTN